MATHPKLTPPIKTLRAFDPPMTTADDHWKAVNLAAALVRSSPATRTWLKELRDRLPQFAYSEAKYWATFRQNGKTIAHLNPSRHGIRLFLPLLPGANALTRPTPSTSGWAKAFPAVFQISEGEHLSEAARLIAKSGLGIDPSTATIDVETQDLSDELIDQAIRENRLRIGIVATDSELAIVRQRRGQERVRRLVLLNYDSTCALCDVNDPHLLVASHIVGWAVEPEKRGMLANVICLCRFHDVLFEQGYWSLADDFTVIRRSHLGHRIVEYLLDGAVKFRQPHDHSPVREFLHHHRSRCGLSGGPTHYAP